MFNVDAYDLSPQSKERIARMIRQLRESGHSWDQIMALASEQKIPISLRTLQRYAKCTMSTDAQHDRRTQKCGRPTKLNEEERQEVTRHASEARAKFLPVGIKKTQDIIKDVTNGRIDNPSPSMCCRHWSREGWSSYKTQS